MIYIIRHGQTALNVARVLQGRQDEPLNDVGRAQAATAGAWFAAQGIALKGVYTSPLVRAAETARIITGGAVPVITDERLMEIDCGPYEGTNLLDPPEEIRVFFSDFVRNPAPRASSRSPTSWSAPGSSWPCCGSGTTAATSCSPPTPSP